MENRQASVADIHIDAAAKYDEQMTAREQMEHDFTNHAPADESVVEAFERLRQVAKMFGREIIEVTPLSKERDQALLYLRQALMWAVGAVACHQEGIASSSLFRDTVAEPEATPVFPEGSEPRLQGIGFDSVTLGDIVNRDDKRVPPPAPPGPGTGPFPTPEVLEEAAEEALGPHEVWPRG